MKQKVILLFSKWEIGNWSRQCASQQKAYSCVTIVYYQIQDIRDFATELDQIKTYKVVIVYNVTVLFPRPFSSLRTFSLSLKHLLLAR